ncbi:MAG TPA: hypothetical protein VF753_00900 [Terriglobales bacterium]
MNQRASSLLLPLLMVLSLTVCAQTPASPYPKMAPVDQYLIADRNVEINMARSAAPSAISDDAEILVLTKQGYVTAVKGTNGFACVVERGWMSPFDAPNFWNPRLRGPICFNPPAVHSILPITIKRTEMVLSGLPKEQIIARSTALVANKELPPLEPGAMSYMMSREGFLDDSAGHWVPHLMFYTPLAEGSLWGADVPDSPVYLNPQFRGAPEPIDVFMIPVGKWSDGLAAPLM